VICACSSARNATEGIPSKVVNTDRRLAKRRTDCDGSLRRNNRSENARANRPGTRAAGCLTSVHTRRERKFISEIRRADSLLYQPEVTLLRIVTAACSRSLRVTTDTFGSNRYERNSRSTKSLTRRQINGTREAATSVSTIRIDIQWSVSRFRSITSLNHRTGTQPKNLCGRGDNQFC
jgi:hypothetical protein